MFWPKWCVNDRVPQAKIVELSQSTTLSDFWVDVPWHFQWKWKSFHGSKFLLPQFCFTLIEVNILFNESFVYFHGINWFTSMDVVLLPRNFLLPGDWIYFQVIELEANIKLTSIEVKYGSEGMNSSPALSLYTAPPKAGPSRLPERWPITNGTLKNV